MKSTKYSEELKIKPEAAKACRFTELVKGCEGRLIDEIAPLVRTRSVRLDLGLVERIDAAGIAALITLYGMARDSGNDFRVENVRPRVEEMLALVGLDGILLSRNAVHNPHACLRMAQNAA